MKTLLQQYLQQHYHPTDTGLIEMRPVPKGQTGDLALSFFALAKRDKTSPVQLAQQVQSSLADCDLIAESTIAGPYLNVTFAPAVFFTTALQTPLTVSDRAGEVITVEYSSPNTNKPLHLGHMRNHALGLSVSRLLAANGATVHPVCIVNDRGVHICKSMLAYQRLGQDETPTDTGEKPDHFVGRYYVAYEKLSKQDPTLEAEVQAMLVQWEAGDPEVVALWRQMNDWTLSGHTATYARQGVEFTKQYFESETYLAGKDIAQTGLKSGTFYQREDGAICIDLQAQNLGQKVILRPNGTSVYVTQDLALAVQRKAEFNTTEMIYVVADEQNYHFQVLFASLSALGLISAEHLTHLAYGLVNLPDGRMKSREGNVVDADHLMDELSANALTQITARHPDLPVEQAHTLAEQIMNAAWKFYLLTVSPRKTMTFDAQQSIAFEGATGPYLQYAGVRLRSIFRKAELDISGRLTPEVEFFTSAEKPLGVKILEFPSVLRRAADQHNPTYLTTYLLELAQAWSSYYAGHSILQAETDGLRLARLALAQKVYTVLEQGLSLLSIEIPERM